MKRRILAFFCVLALLCQPAMTMDLHHHAQAEGISTPSDQTPYCEQCGGAAQMAYAVDDDGSHVMMCPHGVTDEGTRHEENRASCVSVDDANHNFYCSCGLAVATDIGHYDTCTNPGVCAACGATDVTMGETNHNWDEDNYEHDDTQHWTECLDCGEKISLDTHSAHCTSQTVCRICGATDVTISSVVHTGYDPYDTYVYNETFHWHGCVDCGWKSSIGERHTPRCTDPTVCGDCGATDVNLFGMMHNLGEYGYDDTQHWRVCLDCGEKIHAINHYTSCANPGVCSSCGATNVTMTVAHEFVYDEPTGYDETQHWYECACGEVLECLERHFASCANPTVCAGCGATDVTIGYTSHNYDGDIYEHSDTRHWRVCLDCGEKFYSSSHYDTCTTPGVCAECGETDVTIGWTRHISDWNFMKRDDTQHWTECLDCGEVYREDHYDFCTDPGVCAGCGEADVTMSRTTHYRWVVYEHDATQHWFVCTECGEKVEEAHVPSATDPSKCEVCGATLEVATSTAAPTTEPTVAPTAEPTAEPTEVPAEPTAAPAEPTNTPIPLPTLEPTAEPTAEPAAEPTVEPTAKPATPTVTEAPVHIHTYDIAFTANGDGTHSKVCLACGEGKITENCQLVTTDMGLMTCTACSLCGHATYTAKSAVSTLTEGENVPAVVRRVETAAIAAADAAAPEAVPADAVLLVHETTFDVPVTLREALQGTVEKVFTAVLVKDGVTVQPTGQVKLSIPVDEATLAALEGKVLMLLREDGTLVEVAYEVIDGQLVFLTEELGVFLLMQPETAA